MAIAEGTRLGPYEILAPIGAGGMGEVYRARDIRLDRIVALKVIPEASAALPETRARFEREARAVSSLNHPHICSLFDIGHQDGVDYLVMEYLEGESLAARLKKGPLPLDQALHYAIDIVGALDAAHRYSIVHRDLKPSNIMLTPTGPKVLDFGLAKIPQQRAAVVAGGSLLETVTTPLTGHGTIVGTLQYMAPEQLEGKEADARTDLFAFGALIYEMLTGRRAFQASSQAALISAIMTAEPAPVSAVQPLATPSLDHVVRTCIAKDPADRWQSAHDLLVQLKWVTGAGSQAAVTAPVAVRRKSREGLLWASVVTLTVALLAVSFLLFRAKPAEARPASFQIPLPPKVTWGSARDIPAVSPDGRKLVFAAAPGAGKRILWLRSLDTLTIQPLHGTEDALFPFWSPDSRFVGFFAGQELKKTDLAGASPQTLCDVGSGFTLGGSWSRNGIILFGKVGSFLRQVPASGGEPKPALPLDQSRREVAQGFPWFLPDGQHFLYASRSLEVGKSAIRLGALGSTETRLVVTALSNSAFAPPGLLLFSRQQSLMGQAFDPSRLQATGDPFPIAEGVGRLGPVLSPFSVSSNGVLIWRGGESANAQIAAYSRDGRRLGSVGEPREIRQLFLSPDEKRLSIEMLNFPTGGANRDVWLVDLANNIFSRVTYDPAADYDPIWSPDGRELVLSSSRKSGNASLYRKVLGGPPEQLLFEFNEPIYAQQWLPGGSLLFLTRGGRAFYRLPLTGERKPEMLFQSEFEKDGPTVSPDGRSIAYNSFESGRWEVYLASFPAFTERRQVSNAGGCQPLWRKDGKELFYLTLEGHLMAVDIKPGAAAGAGLQRELFRVPMRPDPTLNQYAITGDGRKFLVLEDVDEGPSPLTVVLNFTAGLAH
jgi:hypothetical protein